MSAFRAYNSIENHTRAAFVQRVRATAQDEEWCATEKIHGANLSMIVGDNIQRASRRQMLADAPFHGSERIRDELNDALHKLRADVAQPQIHIYGEIYGGDYPGVRKQYAGSSRVQKGVWYAADTAFRVFDIYDGNDYINYDRVIDLCRDAGVPVCPIAHRGSLDEMLALDPVFPSTVPAMHGMPEIEKNFAEGWVLKPVTARHFGHDRVIIKLKNPGFSEVASQPRMSKDNVRKAAIRCVTQNRVDTTRSKLVDPSREELIAALVDDVLDEVRKDHELTDDAATQLREVVARAAARIVP